MSGNDSSETGRTDPIPLLYEKPAEAAERPPRGLILIGLACLVAYGVLLALGDLREHLGLFLGIFGLLAVCYLAALLVLRRTPPRRLALGVVIGGAVLFRVLMLASPPSLSDDVHRYVRDGWVQVNGLNPYAHAPGDPALEHLRLPDHDKINNPSIPTIYPPLAQVVFAAAALVSPSPFMVKLILVLFDIGTVLLLLYWVRALGGNPLGITIYAWHPLAVIEGAGSGHVDVVGAFFLVLSVSLIIGSRKFASSAALAGAVLAKLLPILLVPLFARRYKDRHLLVFAAILLVVTGPYLAGAGWQMFAGFGEYAQRWEFNGASYLLVHEAIDFVQPTETLKSILTTIKRALRDPVFLEPVYDWLHPPHLARAVLLACLALALVWVALQSMAPEREAVLGLGAILLLSPTLHPWYLLWILPFLALCPSPPWTWMSLAVPLSYLALLREDGSVPLWVLLVEYGGMIVLVLIGWWRRGGSPEKVRRS